MAHAKPLEKSGLLNLLEIPHFRRCVEVNAMVRVILSCVNGGYLWLSSRVDIGVDLTHRITGLSKHGKDPQIQIDGKTKDSRLLASQVDEYQLQRGGRAYDLTALKDQSLKFTASLLAGRLLTKVRPKEVTGSVIKLAIEVTKGIDFNWSLFLLNIFLQDCAHVQDDANHSFHFSWLLILMAFMGWRDPPHTQFPNLHQEHAGLQSIQIFGKETTQ